MGMHDVITKNEIDTAKTLAAKPAGLTCSGLMAKLGCSQNRAKRILSKTKGLKAVVASKVEGSKLHNRTKVYFTK